MAAADVRGLYVLCFYDMSIYNGGDVVYPMCLYVNLAYSRVNLGLKRCFLCQIDICFYVFRKASFRL